MSLPLLNSFSPDYYMNCHYSASLQSSEQSILFQSAPPLRHTNIPLVQMTAFDSPWIFHVAHEYIGAIQVDPTHLHCFPPSLSYYALELLNSLIPWENSSSSPGAELSGTVPFSNEYCSGPWHLWRWFNHF